MSTHILVVVCALGVLLPVAAFGDALSAALSAQTHATKPVAKTISHPRLANAAQAGIASQGRHMLSSIRSLFQKHGQAMPIRVGATSKYAPTSTSPSQVPYEATKAAERLTRLVKQFSSPEAYRKLIRRISQMDPDPRGQYVSDVYLAMDAMGEDVKQSTLQIIRQLGDSKDRAIMLAEFGRAKSWAHSVRTSSRDAIDYWTAAIEDATKVEDERVRAELLSSLASLNPPESVWRRLIEMAEQLSELHRRHALLGLTATEFPEAVVPDLVAAMNRTDSPTTRATNLTHMARIRRDDVALWKQALEAAQQIDDGYQRGGALTQVGAAGPPDSLWSALLDATESLDPRSRSLTLSKFIKDGLPNLYIHRVIALANDTEDPFARALLFTRIAAAHDGSLWTHALEAAEQIDVDSRSRAIAFSNLAKQPLPDMLTHRLVQGVRELGFLRERAEILADLAARNPSLWNDVFAALDEIEEVGELEGALFTIARAKPPLEATWTQLIERTERLPEYGRGRALGAFARAQPPEQVWPKLFAAADNIERWQAERVAREEILSAPVPRRFWPQVLSWTLPDRRPTPRF